MGLSKIDNPEKLATYEEKHNKNTTQYVVGHPVYANKQTIRGISNTNFQHERSCKRLEVKMILN